MGISTLTRRIKNWFPSKKPGPFDGPPIGLPGSHSVANFPYTFGGRAIESGDILDVSIEELPLPEV